MATTKVLDRVFVAQKNTDCLHPYAIYHPEDIGYVWDSKYSEPVGFNQRYAHCEILSPQHFSNIEEF